MEYKYKLATTTWDNLEYDAIQRVVNSEMFTMGKEVKIFEEQFASFFGKKYAIMVNSGSSANLIMIAALFYKKNNPLKEGDEIIVPAVSWSTTYLPLQQYKLKVKFVDIDLDTLNFNLDELAKAITSQTKVVLAVNLLGNPNNFDQINHLIKDKNIILLEDNCESMGAKFSQKYAGSIGFIGTFSSFFSHHISTMEGGIIITDDEEIYHICLSLRAHGWTRNLPLVNRVTNRKSSNDFEESYKFVLPGYNVRPLELSGAIGQEQLKKLPYLVNNRRLNAEKFIRLIKKFNWIIPQKEIGESSWFGFSLIIKENSGKTREMLIKALERNSIEYRPIVAGNFLKNPVIKFFNYEIHDKLVNSEYIDNFGLFIGNHHYDLSEEFSLLEKALKEL